MDRYLSLRSKKLVMKINAHMGLINLNYLVYWLHIVIIVRIINVLKFKKNHLYNLI